jgi:hypothetical protein
VILVSVITHLLPRGTNEGRFCYDVDVDAHGHTLDPLLDRPTDFEEMKYSGMGVPSNNTPYNRLLAEDSEIPSMVESRGARKNRILHERFHRVGLKRNGVRIPPERFIHQAEFFLGHGHEFPELFVG